jgi:rod shape-determining protein MreC
MLNADTRQQHQIIRTLTISIFFPFQFTLNKATEIKNIFTENKKLKQEITALTTLCASLEEAARENKRLRDLLGFREPFSYTLLPARTVVREPSFLFRSIVINAGRDQGVAVYMPVVNKDGVVGKVIQVLSQVSLVQILRDPSECVSVMTKKNEEVGILETNDSRNFFIQYRRHADITKGDTVVTSGLGGIYPRGLGVGIVCEIKDNHDPLFKKAFIEPLVEFNRLEEVFVIKLSPQWAAFRKELDSIALEKEP